MPWGHMGEDFVQRIPASGMKQKAKTTFFWEAVSNLLWIYMAS
jgi:hypothetical protein